MECATSFSVTGVFPLCEVSFVSVLPHPANRDTAQRDESNNANIFFFIYLLFLQKTDFKLTQLIYYIAIVCNWLQKGTFRKRMSVI